jgi:hypothetical protein
MQKLAFTTVFLIAVLITGAINTMLPPMFDKEAYHAPDRKAYAESDKDKSPKKLKLIECNNRNINADEIEDFSTIEPILNQAFTSNNDEINDQTQIYYLEPDTMIVFNCNNQNHNLNPVENTDVADTPRALLPSIQQMNPTIQQNSLPPGSGDPLLQLQPTLSPIS